MNAGKACCATAFAAVFVFATGTSGCGEDPPEPGISSGSSGNTSAGGKGGTAGKGSGGKGGGGGTAGNGGARASGGSSGKGGTPQGGAGGQTDGGGTSGSAGSNLDSGAGGASGGGGAGGTGGGGGAGGGVPEAGALVGNGTIDPGEECDDSNKLDEDTCTSVGSDNRPCLDCITNNCPFDPVYQPRCSDYSDAASRDACYKTYACAIATECFLNAKGPQYCYCGDADAPTCKDGSGTGPCKAVIDAAFAAAPGQLTVVDSNAVVSNYTDVRIPAAGALSSLYCQYGNCGSVAPGNLECSPTRHPKYSIPDAGTRD